MAASDWRPRLHFSYWHKAAEPGYLLDGRFRGESGHDVNSRIRSRMTRLGHLALLVWRLSSLKEVYIKSGHYMAQEQPVAVNRALARFIAEKLPKLLS